MNESRRAGFTLIEVIVALMIAGMIALLAHALFAAAADGAQRLEAVRSRMDQDQNGRSFLRGALLALEAGAEAGPFEGEPHRLRFSTWLLTSDGWSERRTVVLALAGSRWTASLASRPASETVLADSVAELNFDYLLKPGADAHWVTDWHSEVSAPLAVRVRATHLGGECDTSLYLIKGRG
jgi:prepilin-type N-terminal cleavage/methylation domain-containing protein